MRPEEGQRGRGATDPAPPGPVPTGEESPLRRLSFGLHEVSGALGDLGVLVPIMAVLILNNGFNATAVLLVFGLAYIGAGLYYRLPMPVQPLKAMAAIAIAQGLTPETVSAAGLIMAAALLALAVSGLMTPLAGLFPRPIVRGIQAGLGLLLVQAGFRLWFSPQVLRDGPELFVAAGSLAVPAGALVAAGLGAILLLALVYHRLPASLLVLAAALAIGAVVGSLDRLGTLHFGPQLPSVAAPSGHQLLTALVVLVIPQLPLTLGNAVIASADTARGYFGDDARRVTHRSLLISSGLTNALAGLLGGMPACHGSGGITAHYRFGARTGGAGVIMGGILLALALGFGDSAASVLSLIPLPALGFLLTVVGVQHALLARDSQPGIEWLVVATIAGVAVITQNLAIGFGAGIALYQAWRLPHVYRWLRSRLQPLTARPAQADTMH